MRCWTGQGGGDGYFLFDSWTSLSAAVSTFEKSLKSKSGADDSTRTLFPLFAPSPPFSSLPTAVGKIWAWAAVGMISSTKYWLVGQRSKSMGSFDGLQPFTENVTTVRGSKTVVVWRCRAVTVTVGPTRPKYSAQPT